eukprot:8604695-Pyramimonas_sp.AAC.1
MEEATMMSESFAAGKHITGVGQNPEHECKATQQLKTFAGCRSKSCEWSNNLLTALAQATPHCRKALTSGDKLETMSVTLHYEFDDDMVMILKCSLAAERC